MEAAHAATDKAMRCICRGVGREEEKARR